MGLHVDPPPCRVPTGAIFIWLADIAPNGWLLCYGQAVSRSAYARLFTVIGTTFGIGDGSTTFNLPDFRGRSPLVKDDLGGVSADRVTNAQADVIGGSAGDEDIPEHTHIVPFKIEGTVGSTSIGNVGSGVDVETNSTGTGVNNMSPYLTIACIIKY